MAVGSLSASWHRRKKMAIQSRHSDRIRIWEVEPDGRSNLTSDSLRTAIDWADGVLIDLPGSRSRFDNTVAAIADITIIPTRRGRAPRGGIADPVLPNDGQDDGDDSGKQSPEVGEDLADVVTAAAEHGEDRVTEGALEEAP